MRPLKFSAVTPQSFAKTERRPSRAVDNTLGIRSSSRLQLSLESMESLPSPIRSAIVGSSSLSARATVEYTVFEAAREAVARGDESLDERLRALAIACGNTRPEKSTLAALRAVLDKIARPAELPTDKAAWSKHGVSSSTYFLWKKRVSKFSMAADGLAADGTSCAALDEAADAMPLSREEEEAFAEALDLDTKQVGYMESSASLDASAKPTTSRAAGPAADALTDASAHDASAHDAANDAAKPFNDTPGHEAPESEATPTRPASPAPSGCGFLRIFTRKTKTAPDAPLPLAAPPPAAPLDIALDPRPTVMFELLTPMMVIPPASSNTSHASPMHLTPFHDLLNDLPQVPLYAATVLGNLTQYRQVL